ncbi:hypothetical protein T03_16035 [Trichinella britovi]|uniref:Uncharacterized protein n=2 Tax=Trichinella TaxID=6333 RepID=A0A0V0YZH3_TRIBR|nr:hypothetical protein T05_2446 [Trichinella murrelli]KRX31445.1 hypothetical protein T09_11021 [Trichinella sp. T9]KRY05459.1 hypothetical protein T03_14004 [Trichinella britovi]KRY06014.1 hypothetical protein T03_16035 [Trichinella britovi]
MDYSLSISMISRVLLFDWDSDYFVIMKRRFCI